MRPPLAPAKLMITVLPLTRAVWILKLMMKDLPVAKGTRSAVAMVEDTADTAPPIACVATGLMLLKSLEVATQMPALHPACWKFHPKVTPVSVRVTAAAAASPALPTAIVKLVVETSVADVAKMFATPKFTPTVLPER